MKHIIMGVKRKRRNSGPNKDPPNLKRFRADVLKLSSESTEASSTHENSDSRFKKKQTRKEKRKETRLLKKARRSAYRSGQPMPSLESVKKYKDTEVSLQTKKEKQEKIKEKRKKEKEKQKEKKKEKKRKDEEEKKRAMRAEIQREEKMLKQLEKQLHMNKRKNKNLPQAFINDGLDYILDAVDESKVKAMYKEDEDLSDEDADIMLEEEDDELLPTEKSDEGDDSDDNDMMSEDENQNLFDDNDSEEEMDSDNENSSDDNLEDSASRGKARLKVKDQEEEKSNVKSILKSKTKEKMKKKSKEKEKEKEKDKHVKFEASESDDAESDDSVLSDDENDDSKDESVSSVSNEPSKAALKEDIYGRLRDEEGNIVRDPSLTQRYIPPGKRLEMATSDEKKRIQIERLKKQLNGLVNRASESNMQPITSQIEALYLHHSRADVTETLSSLIIGACVTPVLTPERLAMELMMLISILHGNVGTEVGATFIQMLAQNFNNLLESPGTQYGQGKEMDNVLLLFSHLYNFKVIHSVMIFDIILKFIDSFGEKDIELLLLILKNVGFSLRKDDPNALKETILQIQSKASSLDPSQFSDQSRVKFMLDVLMAIKNNNMRKIPNYNPELFDQLKKVTRNVLKGSNLGDGQLRISLQDLINAEKLGRWWIVGSAWEGQGREEKPGEDTSSRTTVVGDVSGRILELARKQRMNTDIRRNIFCVVMTSEDFVDAFEKLLRLGLKNQQEREIIHVIIDCCLQQKEFNPFYAYLMQKFCEHHRRFQMTFQFSLWDKFQEMSNLSEQNRHNLAKMVTHLIATKALSLSVFKVVEFGTLDKTMVRFIKQILQAVLLDYPEEAVTAVFMRIAPLSKLYLLHEGLKLFMQHFLLRKKAKDVRDSPILKERIEMAEKILSSEQSKL